MVAIILKEDFKENKRDDSSFEKKSEVRTPLNGEDNEEHASFGQLKRNIYLHLSSANQLMMLVFLTMILSSDILYSENPPVQRPEKSKKIIRELAQNKKRVVMTLMLNGILILSSGITLLARTTTSKRVRIGIRILAALMVVVAFYNVLNAIGMTCLGSKLTENYQCIFFLSAGLQILIFLSSLKSYKKISDSAPPAITNSYLNLFAVHLLGISIYFLIQSILWAINVYQDYCVDSDDCPLPFLEFNFCVMIWCSVQTLVGVIGIHASLRNSKKLIILSRFSATTVFAIYSFIYFCAFTTNFGDVYQKMPFVKEQEDLVAHKMVHLISTLLSFGVMIATWMPFQDFSQCTWTLIKSKDRRGFKEIWVLLDEKEEITIEKIPFNSSAPKIKA